ncbi:MAG: glycosyltransferase family 4 protein [Methylacidiphilales bacterium]|nr:glycosyltransferase family 4 protein [Candidatus Methylacidiphilales bacterium]MDW8348922.1 glycosyltransferase family 4 protein [Verrucomicrobiae bacterium]
MLLIFTSHPIQYQAPLWGKLAESNAIPFEVLFLSSRGACRYFDPEFQRDIAWDIPMLEGYSYTILNAPERPDHSSAATFRNSFEDILLKKKVTHLWVHGWAPWPMREAIHIAHNQKIKIWLTAENHNLGNPSSLRIALKKIFLSPIFRKIDTFLVIGSANHAFYKSFSISDSRLVRFPYSVDNDRFHAQSQTLRPIRLEIRQRWHIPPHAYCALFCGKLIPKKRPTDLIAAARLCMRQNPSRPIHLLFCGTGPLKKTLTQTCSIAYDAESPQATPQKKHDHPQASFIGFLNQTEIPQAYVAADCLVLPSDYRETWGLVVNEAMASDCPAIISDQCGCAPDLAVIPPNRSYPCGDVSALAQAMLSLHTSATSPHQLYHKLSAAGHHYTHLVDQIRRLYSSTPS